MNDILIHYTEADRSVAKQIEERLESEQMHVRPVSEDASVEPFLPESRIYVILFSENANRSGPMLDGLQKAAAAGKIIIPLRLTGEKPAEDFHYYLGPIHWLDGRDENLTSAIDLLCRRCKSVLSLEEKKTAPVKKRILIGCILCLIILITAVFCWFRSHRQLQAGDHVFFGSYGASEENRDRIEWLVLEVDPENKTCLLVSVYCIDTQPYHITEKGVTWESCSLRKWLNEDFFRLAFTEEEQDLILPSEVSNSSREGRFDFLDIGYTSFGTDGGNDTIDLVYILSSLDVQNYFPDSKDRIVRYTESAAQKSHTDLCRWWLRFAGKYQDTALIVDESGNRSYESVNAENIGIRPVIRMSLL